MNTLKKHTWWVDTGMYHKQLGCRSFDMENARKQAYERLISMPYNEFIKYVSLNVSGFKKSYE